MPGSYVPFLLESFQPYGYAYHVDDTADGKLPSPMDCLKSSVKISFQPDKSVFGIGTPDGFVDAGVGVGVGVGLGETGAGVGVGTGI
jgi:hypothetical protein